MKLFNKKSSDDTIITMEDFKKEARKVSRRNKAKNLWNNVKEFASENTELAIVIVTGVFGVITGATKGITKVLSSKNKNSKDITHWDAHERHHWHLKRKPTNEEWAIISEREKNGESLKDIFDSLKILK